MRRGQFSVLIIALLLAVPIAPLSAGSDVPTPPTTILDDAHQPEPATEVSVDARDRAEPGLLDALDPVNHVIVRFDESVDDELLDRLDIEIPYSFESLPAVYAVAPAAAVETMAHRSNVAHIERADKPIEFDLDTATLASKAREVWDPAADNPALDGDPGPIEVDGQPVDGAGVGIAILDTGIDATHLDYVGSGKLAGSFLATPAGVIEAPYHSPQNGHGTLVAGAAAGTGEASGGELAGAAPGASLYSFAIQHVRRHQLDIPGISFPAFEGVQGDAYTLSPAIAMDWILQHGDEQDPPIKVVNNAWHCKTNECKASDGSEQIHSQLATRLVENGTVVTWAFGNFASGWNAEATNPTQGVIGVAGYDDNDLGIREGCESSGFSEGDPLDPSTWPDVIAPATSITSTAALGAFPDTRQPVRQPYDRATGSSLSAAHVAGAAALMLQANPELAPAEVEWILEDTASKLPEDPCGLVYNKGDPTHPTSGANHEVGHGLIDAYAAVEAAIGFTGIPDTDETAVEPNRGFLEPGTDEPDNYDTVAVTDRLYLSGADGLSGDRPTADESQSRLLGPNEAATFTSEPFTEHVDVTGIDSSIWVRVVTEPLTELYGRNLANTNLQLTVQQIDPEIGLEDSVVQNVIFPWSPLDRVRERPFVKAFENPLSFEPGDRLKVEVELTEAGVAGDGSQISAWQIHWGSAENPSHVGIGERALDIRETYRDCREENIGGCVWIDADHPSGQIASDGGIYEVTWEGPGGTGILFHQYKALARCEIPEDQAWGSCTRITHSSSLAGNGPHTCQVIDPAAPNPGQGRCRLIEEL